MDEHEDDLASEVKEGEEIETDTFEPEGEDDVRAVEHPEPDEEDAADDGEI
jgi:hypothetical protein